MNQEKKKKVFILDFIFIFLFSHLSRELETLPRISKTCRVSFQLVSPISQQLLSEIKCFLGA